MRRSSELPDARRFDELWRRARVAPSRCLMLDFDGTLAPFELDRHRATLRPTIGRALRELSGRTRTRIAIISGRPLEEIETRFEEITARLVGEHGWCERREDGTTIYREPSSSALEALHAGAERLARTIPGERLERKRASLVVHSRGLPDLELWRLRQATLAAWIPLLADGAVDLQTIDGGWELRARGRDKGTAVRELLREAGSREFAAYLGDDETDEDGFAAVAPLGFGIRVSITDRATRAVARLPGVDAVEEWLALWTERLGSGAESAFA